MEIKGFLDFQTKTLDINSEYIEIEGYASVQTKDRDGDIVIPQGIDLSNFSKNPILLYNHRTDEPAGKIVNYEITDKGLYVKARVYKDVHPKAYAAVKNGIMRAFSIGFIGKDGTYDENSDTFFFTKSELLEISIVSIPANGNAVFDLVETPCGNGFCLGKKEFSKYKEKGMEKKVGEVKIDNKTISLEDWSAVDKTALAKRLDDLDDSRAIKECYLAVGDLEKRSTFCCPHHELTKDNTLIVNKKGVIAAYAALKGARGNKPNLTQEEYNKAMKHIAKHYKELYRQELIDEIPEDLKEFIMEDTKDVGGLEELKSRIAELEKKFESLVEAKNDAKAEDNPVEEKEVSLEEAFEVLEKALENEENIESLIEFFDKFNKDLNQTIEKLINQ